MADTTLPNNPRNTITNIPYVTVGFKTNMSILNHANG